MGATGWHLVCPATTCGATRNGGKPRRRQKRRLNSPRPPTYSAVIRYYQPAGGAGLARTAPKKSHLSPSGLESQGSDGPRCFLFFNSHPGGFLNQDLVDFFPCVFLGVLCFATRTEDGGRALAIGTLYIVRSPRVQAQGHTPYVPYPPPGAAGDDLPSQGVPLLPRGFLYSSLVPGMKGPGRNKFVMPATRHRGPSWDYVPGFEALGRGLPIRPKDC
jgi:hypothetical protein